MVLDHTPFYAESGGQVGDRGELTKGGICLTLFEVQDTQKIQPDVFGHHGVVKTGELAVGDTVAANVDLDKRARTMRHHSATHLMHKALREVLGPHVQQKGSLVDEDKTRFDFSHNAPMTRGRDPPRRGDRERRGPRATRPTSARVMPIDDAQKLGAMMLFGEKYGDEVRVLDIGTLARALRRHARRAHRRHRPLPHHLRRRRGRRHPPRRGGRGHGGARATCSAESERLARVAAALKAQPAGGRGEARRSARERARAREGARAPQGEDGDRARATTSPAAPST